jgi:hypothetical protein
VGLILDQKPSLEDINFTQIHKIKLKLKNEKMMILKGQFEKIIQTLSPKSRQCLQLAAEKGTSLWLRSENNI